MRSLGRIDYVRERDETQVSCKFLIVTCMGKSHKSDQISLRLSFDDLTLFLLTKVVGARVSCIYTVPTPLHGIRPFFNLISSENKRQMKNEAVCVVASEMLRQLS